MQRARRAHPPAREHVPEHQRYDVKEADASEEGRRVVLRLEAGLAKLVVARRGRRASLAELCQRKGN